MSEMHSEVTDLKRKGRPPLNRPVDKAAEKLAERSILPPPPGRTISFDQMQEYFALLSPDMWAHASVYLYRTRPRIIRQLKDPEAKNYIDVVSHPLTLEYMIDRHGGGRYSVEMTSTDFDNGGPDRQARGHLFKCNFEVDEVRYPPKLDYEELDIAHKENMSYVALLKHNRILDSNGKVMNPNQPQNSNSGSLAGASAEVVDKLLNFVTKMSADQQALLRSRLAPEDDGISKSISTILIEKLKQDDPNRSFETLTKVVAAVKDMTATARPPEANIYAPLLTIVTEQNKVLMGMLQKERAPEPAQNPMAQFNQVIEAIGKLDGLGLTGRGGGGRRSGWDVGLDYVKEIVPPAVSVFQHFFPFMRGAAAPQPVAPGQPPAPARVAFDPYRDQAAMHAYSESLRNQAPAAAQQQPQPGMPAGAAPPPNDLLSVLRQYSPIVVGALNNGTDGADFGDYVIGLLGIASHAALAQAGEEGITQTMMQIPELAIFGPVKLRAFAHGFVHTEEILDARESQAAPAQAAA